MIPRISAYFESDTSFAAAPTLFFFFFSDLPCREGDMSRSALTDNTRETSWNKSNAHALCHSQGLKEWLSFLLPRCYTVYYPLPALTGGDRTTGSMSEGVT